MALTSEDLNQIKGIMTDTENRLTEKIDSLDTKINGVKAMLEDDYRAEARRLTNVDGRVRKLRRDFNIHVRTESSG